MAAIFYTLHAQSSGDTYAENADIADQFACHLGNINRPYIFKFLPILAAPHDMNVIRAELCTPYNQQISELILIHQEAISCQELKLLYTHYDRHILMWVYAQIYEVYNDVAQNTRNCCPTMHH